MQHIVNRWIRFVESTGSEVGITLLIGGTTIVGYLTPMLRYEAWLTEVLLRTIHEGGHSTLPSIEMPPISPEITQRVRDEWEAGGTISENEHPDEPVGATGPGCAIRNAEVRPPGVAKYWRTYPYLHVQVSAIDAIYLGHTPTPSLP